MLSIVSIMAHKMRWARDADVLLSTSTYVSNMSSTLKEAPTSKKSLTTQKASRLKMMVKRLVKQPYIYKSPFVDACAQKFNKI